MTTVLRFYDGLRIERYPTWEDLNSPSLSEEEVKLLGLTEEEQAFLKSVKPSEPFFCSQQEIDIYLRPARYRVRKEKESWTSHVPGPYKGQIYCSDLDSKALGIKPGRYLITTRENPPTDKREDVILGWMTTTFAIRIKGVLISSVLQPYKTVVSEIEGDYKGLVWRFLRWELRNLLRKVVKFYKSEKLWTPKVATILEHLGGAQATPKITMKVEEHEKQVEPVTVELPVETKPLPENPELTKAQEVTNEKEEEETSA